MIERFVAAGVAVALAIGCKRDEPRTADAVPGTTGPIEIDGDWNEPDWSRHALRAQFIGDDGALARPSSEVRFLRDGSTLFVALYAADEDIQDTDAFQLEIGALALTADATGAIHPPMPDWPVAVRLDEGTIDNPTDDDEEWVVELAIPAKAAELTAGTRQHVHASRCDVPKDGRRRCGTWSGTISF
jgi:hypothetical protein